MKNVSKLVFHDGSNQRMNMIRHHDITAEQIPLAIEMTQRLFNQSGYVRVS